MRGPASSPPSHGASDRTFSDLSIELGHLTARHLERDVSGLTAYFRRLRPWADAAVESVGRSRPRVSTCVLIDDYFLRLGPPSKLLPNLIDAAEKAGWPIDYIVRESGLVTTGNLRLAETVERLLPPDRLVERSRTRAMSAELAQKKAADQAILPSRDSPYRHLISVDVELWDERSAGRVWSCSFLAAVWQLLRLGLIREFADGAIAGSRRPDIDIPDSWTELPAIVQVTPHARPFYAARTFSILPTRFIAIEHAVQIILGEISTTALNALPCTDGPDRRPSAQEYLDRIEYLFAADG